MSPHFPPMRLLRIPEPFDHTDWLFEVKFDGFRALAHTNDGQCQLISRNGHIFKSWPQLSEEIAHSLRAHFAILDGEIVCLDADGRSNFKNLLFRREGPFFYAFDLLACDGEDLRELPLVDRKRLLRRIMPRSDSQVFLMDHIEERACHPFAVVCERNPEGIVAKWRPGRDASDGPSTGWMKIKNPANSELEGRHELFQPTDRRRQSARVELRLD